MNPHFMIRSVVMAPFKYVDSVYASITYPLHPFQVIDYMLCDALELLKKPPLSVTSVLRNTWVPTSIRFHGLRGAIWTAVQARASMYPNGSFMAEIALIYVTFVPTLACGLLGVGESDFIAVCNAVVERLFSFVRTCFAFPGAENGLTLDSYIERIIEAAQRILGEA